jgi:hypothetical protein
MFISGSQAQSLKTAQGRPIMKRSTSAASLASLFMALVCFAGTAALFHGDNARGQNALFIADSGFGG